MDGRTALLLLALLAGAGHARSVLRAGLWEGYAQGGLQSRTDPRWSWVEDSMSFLDSYWQEHPRRRLATVLAAGAGVFLNDNFRLGARVAAVGAAGRAPSPDSLVVSLEGAFFARPSGPWSAALSARAGLAPGFPRRDPPGTQPLYSLRVPPRVYGLAAGLRWIPLENLAVDCDLVDVELWAGSRLDVWHVGWLAPRLSLLF